MVLRSGIPRACLFGIAFLFGLMLAARAEDMPKEMHHDHGMQPDEKMQHDHGEMQHDEKMQHDHGMESKDSTEKKKSSKDDHAGHEEMVGMKHDGHGGHAMDGRMQDAHAGHDMSGHQMEMKGFLGPYSMTREGSGTSWLPDATPHEGVHTMFGDWMLMGHALINGVYDSQGGPRGGNKFFVPGMLMGMAERDFGDSTLGFRAMLSPDPFMGANGYPLLLATGETADGRTPLVDRQHPHDLFMELATTYSQKLSANSSWFVYAGLPGEPALGPSAFMHRTSGMDIPEAPITHHWLDSTHISFGVVTAGLVLDKVKLEASAFRGREPNEHRYDIETGALDSYSTRLSYNPTHELSMQVSWGHLHSPEELMPSVDENRLTASATYTVPFGNDNIWSSTFAWGRKMLQPGETLDGFLLESELIFKNNWTLFMRAEHVKENELLADIATFTTPPVFYVSKISLGGIYDFPVAEHLKFGVGALVSRYGIPEIAKPFYGDPTSYMLFFRLKVS